MKLSSKAMSLTFPIFLCPQVLNAVSIAPVQMQATPIVSIASISGAQPTQIIASSSCPSLAIATNPTQCIPNQGQQLALASNQQPTQIIGTSQITLAPGRTDYIINILCEIMTKSKKLIYLKKITWLQHHRWESSIHRSHLLCQPMQRSPLSLIRWWPTAFYHIKRVLPRACVATCLEF